MTRRTLASAALASLLALSPAAASALDAPPAGDFVHTPAPEQKVNTPLPVYVEYPGAPLGRVIVKYAGTGVKTWSRIEMKRVGRGWGVLIPCAGVTAGAVRYWIQGFDPNGEAAASSGDPKHPFIVPVRETTSSKPPHLPGRAAPQACEPGEAPPEEAVEPAAPPPVHPAPVHEEEPVRAEVAEHPEPAKGELGFARWWVGIAGAADFVSLPAGTALCPLTPSGTPANALSAYCTNPNGTDFPARTPAGGAQNAALVPGSAGALAGGIAPGDLRAMIAVDYALTPSVLFGGRLGYVVNSYPTGGAAVTDHHAFGAKLHLEARGTYVFGDRPLSEIGFAPTVFAGLGISEFDGHAASIVSLATSTGHPPTNQPVDIWITNGPWFLAVGGGVRYQFSQRAAFTGAARVNIAFGGAGALFTFGPEIAFQYGF
jgi:hypothetical protein